MPAKKEGMDKDMMNRLIDQVLIPWQNEKVPDIIPLLILNAYQVHMMG